MTTCTEGIYYNMDFEKRGKPANKAKEFRRVSVFRPISTTIQPLQMQDVANKEAQ